jgi:hypothetical protein
MTMKEFVAFTRLDASDVNAQLVNRPVQNAIINGAFEINQRGYVSAADLASGSYGFDRWKSTFTNTTLTYTSAPAGQLVTINSGGSIEQVVERANLPAGTYTLSWEGTATGRIYNTGATPPSYAASPITVTLDGLANVEVEFTADGATKTLGYVKLESGTSVGPFTRNANTLQGELAACQRYYFRFGGSSVNQRHGVGAVFTSTTAQILIQHPVPMRIDATSIDFALLNIWDYGSNYAVTGITFDAQGPQSTNLNCTISGGTQYRPAQLTSASSFNGFLGLSAEL